MALTLPALQFEADAFVATDGRLMGRQAASAAFLRAV
jgi:hypothetical protein